MKKTNFNGDNGVSSPFITYGAEALTASAGAKKTVILGKAIQAYQYKKAITFNTTSTGAAITESQANFPIAVHLNTSSWTTQAERDAFFDNAGADGKRVNFFDTDLDTALPFEVEYFSNVQGSEEALYWVKVPQIDANSSTDKIYMGYGNDPYHADMSNPQAVWDSNFKMVQHLGDNSWGTSPEAKDSTINANNGTNAGSTDATGQVRKGRNFDGTDDYINIPDADVFSFTDKIFTIGIWVNTTRTGTWDTFISKDNISNWEWRINLDYGYSYKPMFAVHSLAGAEISVRNLGSAVNNGNHHQLVMTGDGSNLKAYQNGAYLGLTSITLSMGNGTSAVLIGDRANRDSPLDGIADEARISKTNRSADWIKLEYYSMKKTNFNGDNGVSSPFITYGSQEATR